MKSLITFVSLVLISLVHAFAAAPAGQRSTTGQPPQPPPPPSRAEYDTIKQQAEKAYGEQSFAIARDLYQRRAWRKIVEQAGHRGD